MKTSKFLFVLLFLTTALFPQEKRNPGVQIEYPRNEPSVSKEENPKVEELRRQLLRAKYSGNTNEAMQLQRELDELTGSVSLVMQNDPNVHLIPAGSSPFTQGDNSIIVIRALERNGIRALATATEQRGTTAGRIWIAAAIAGAGNINDTLWVLYSDNNGQSWIGGGGFIYLGSSFINDELDMEIIENTAGTKYIWIIGSRIQSSQRYITCFIVSSTFTISTFGLSFPNSAVNDVYYRPRITSDNAQFASQPWIYIAACKDSVEGGSYRNTERTATCFLPFTNTPTLTYKPNQFGTSALAPYRFRNFDDIAYFRNTVDSVVLIKTGISSDSTRVYLQKSDIVDFSGGTVILNSSSIQGTALWKNQGRIASNGGFPNLMIVCVEQYSPTDLDIPFFSSTNGGASWSTGYLDYTTIYSTGADVVGRRNTAGKFYTAFTNLNASPNFHNVVSCAAAGNVWGPLVQPVNHISGAPALIAAGPKAGIRFVSNDSCFTLWSENSGSNVWASNGCTPPLIGGINENNGIPSAFRLEQNFPNPFNPTTVIGYQLPVNSFVRLAVFDVLGREVALLVSENKPAGTYEIKFDGSNLASGVYLYKLEANEFDDVKRMLLVK